MDSGSGKPPLSALDDGLGRPSGNLEDSLQSEIQSMLQEQRSRAIGSSRDMGLGINRSGSAPPTVEGSLNAVGGLYGRNHGQVGGWGGGYNNGIMSEEEIRSHPAYSSYYYLHEHLNPRLPPPPLSREDWRGAQRFQAGGSSLGPIGDWSRRTVPSVNDSSLFSMQPGSLVDKAENELMELRNFNGRGIPRQTSSGWLDRSPNDLTGLSGTGLGARRKSFADIVQEGVDRPSVLSDFSSRPASCNSFGHTGEELGLHNTSLEGFGSEGKLMHGFYSGARSSGGVRLGSSDATVHSGPSSVVSSLLRSTPELQNSSVPGLPSASSRVSLAERTCIDSNIQNSELTPLADIATNLSSLRLSDIRNKGRDNLGKNNPVTKLDSQPEFLIGRLSGQNQNLQQQLIDNCNYGSSVSMDYINQGIADESSTNLDASEMSYNGEFNIPRRTYSSVSLYSNANSLGSGSLERSNVSYNNANNSGLDLGANIDQERLNNIKNQARLKLQSSDMDTQYVHYPQGISDSSGHAIPGPSFASQFDNCYHTPPGDIALQRAYLETMLAHDRQQYTSDRYGSSHGFGTMYKRNSMPNIVLANAGLGSPIPQNKRLPHSMSRSFMGASIGSRHLETGSHGDGRMASSLLDEFKSNKTHSLGLSDIVDHVVEFSMDQYGSRFIQQKLETAMIEEKVKIFPEIIPHARTLMSDVFGNYVIQKFFEHGTESQRKELADQLRGHVLSLSLHMYGCRVIQKALEVVDVEQQIHMVTELDGSIIKCVYDQNGNHVIQKCIECVPQHRIQFIISTIYGQVVTLSTHPYGCRVIQRVLEHCDDLKTQQIIMDEIMQSVSLLAQDQYGNYVIQHVIEHGKPHERSAIINKLTGNIVKMSQQKFASNVVEKCLAFGSPDERQILVNEMLASDGCDPLPALMKDPFGNYVVQKVLETCNDQSLELLLSRIKDHLNNLKKYTYGKHIVSRIEKLILTGERRIGLSSSLSS